MTTNDLTIPAGWYPSPDGVGERYWDGFGWSTQTRLTAEAISVTSTMDPVVAQVVPVSAPPAPVPPVAAAVPSGWYADPSGAPVQRWFDGNAWTEHTQASPAAQPAMMVSSTVIVGQGAPKSVGVAFLLALFFGPLGMLYATVPGAIIMFVCNLCILALGVVTLGLAWFLFAISWMIGIVWACVAATRAARGPVVVNHQMAR